LAKASSIAINEMLTVAKCPNCEKGKLMVKTSQKLKKKFIACDQYPNCKTIFRAPQTPIIKSIPNQPEEDGHIYVLAGKSEGNLRKVCINPKEEETSGEKKYEEEGMECPVCKKGQMKLRKSFYGEFLGCSNYPNCKTMMKITNGKVDTKVIDMNKKSSKAQKPKGSKAKKK
jgi:ssDNA-binding Zn-finger/Zn-ribbon topoisomerase 1